MAAKEKLQAPLHTQAPDDEVPVVYNGSDLFIAPSDTSERSSFSIEIDGDQPGKGGGWGDKDRKNHLDVP